MRESTTQEPMRPQLKARTIAGFLSLAATLLLSSPGVKLVRAEDADTPPVPAAAEGLSSAAAEGPSCRADAPPAAPAVAELIAQARQQAASRVSSSSEDFVVLNNRGYNYGPPPAIESGLLEAGRRPLQK